jgi:hypothetical protein
MNTIIVKNQAELDALPDSFEEYTAIHIYSDPAKKIIIKKDRANSRAVLWENSSAELWANSSAELRENSSAVLWENSRAELRANSSAVLWANSRAVLWANSRAELWENSSAVLWENSRAVLWENSRAEASHNSVAILRDGTPKCKTSGNAQIVKTETFLHTIESFAEVCKPKRGIFTLYKSVHPDTNYDHYTGKIKYKGTVECPDFDPDPERQCGGGLHLSPTPEGALRYHDGKVLVCEVAKKDIVVYATDITKVRCRKVKVIGEWKEGKQ